MNNLSHHTATLVDGGIVIFPTDTAFGIGCRVDDEKSVERLFRIRRRPVEKATPVLVDSVDMARRYFAEPLPQSILDLMQRHWPGALTIVYYCRTDRIPSLVRGGGKTIGLRMPDHAIALEMIRSVGVPILGPSANFHGHPTPFAMDEIDRELVKLVDGVVEGECKPERRASTVVDCTQNPPKILRQGAVKL